MSKRIISFFMAVVISVTYLRIPAAAKTLDESYDERMEQISELIADDSDTVEAVEKLGRAVVYISVSDGESRAVTVWSSTKRLSSALSKALVKAKDTEIDPKWFRVEIVTGYDKMSYSDFKALVRDKTKGGLHEGVSFNDTFGLSIPDSHINAEGMVDYETGELDLEKINAYFKRNKKKQLAEIPENLIVFSSQSYFSDGSAYKLLNGTRNSTDRRDFSTDKDGLVELAKMSSGYLADICGADGKFIYGYYPIDNYEMEDYNIIRHAGTVWNLILQYDMTRNDELIPVIDRALSYLEEYIHFKNKSTAFVNSSGKYNIGGNGIALLAYTSYAEIFDTDKYNGLIKALANGVLYMQKDNGGFTHSLNSDYTVHRDYIVVFYDGEAMYGLCKAYGVLGTKKYLRAAEKAADYFIANNYEELNSHWISYGFNELTKYSPKTKYFNFGLLNVDNGYTKKVKKTSTAAHTRCETMGAAFELYDRLIQSGESCERLEKFDEKALFEAFEARVSYGLNYFMFPEYAMFFPNPQTVLNSFAVREDNFRIRIDDIQHFMGGYYLYWKNYDRVKSYTMKSEK